MRHSVEQQKNIIQGGHTPTLTFMQSLGVRWSDYGGWIFSTAQSRQENRKLCLQHARQCRGFTLVEMMVSISLFAMVVTMSVGVLLVLIEANGRAQSMQLVMTNLSFALDSMTREIRTGTNWHSGLSGGAPSIPTDESDVDAATDDYAGGNYISISESGNSLTEPYGTDRVTYWFDDDAHGTINGENVGAIMRKLGGYSGTESGWVPLTGKDVDIDSFVLDVQGTDRYLVVNTDVTQPTMTMYIKGKAGFETGASNNNQLREFELQTSVTQRTLDL